MAKHSEREYQELKEFFVRFISRHQKRVLSSAESPSLSRLEEIEKISMSKAFSGLRQAIGDRLEKSLRYDPKEVEEIDSWLRNQGCLTLSEVRKRYSRTYTNIIKRKKIKNDTEFYLIQNILNGFSDNTDEEVDLIQKLISEYEAMHVTKKRP